MDDDIQILLTYETTTCSRCCDELEAGDGVLIQSCLHPFCRKCLADHIAGCKIIPIQCPLKKCNQNLMEKEIKMIVKPEIWNRIEQQTKLSIVQNAFLCKTPNCQGFCELTPGAKLFPCAACGEITCVPCKAIHGSLTCAQYNEEVARLASRGIKAPSRVQEEIMKLLRKTDAFEQMRSTTKQMTGYQQAFTTIENTPLVQTLEEFECTICYDNIAAGDGVILQSCLHVFCKLCIIQHVENNTDLECPCPESNCACKLLPREIRALLPEDVGQKVLKRKWQEAEATLSSKFHCLTPNCDGFCELDGDVRNFKCQICRVTNCIACKAIHEGRTCGDFKNTLVQNENTLLSEQAVEDLITRGEAMRCPKCRTAVQKITGCDAIMCSVCKTELCWATKMARWGPRGRGDNSGGCKCRVGGRKCHPSCTNCH